MPCKRLYNASLRGETKKYTRKAGAGNGMCKRTNFHEILHATSIKAVLHVFVLASSTEQLQNLQLILHVQ